LSAEVRHNLFLAFEEALNNILKHAAAGSVKLEMNCAPDAFSIRISDDGRGFEPGAVAPATSRRGGNGLANLRRRLSAAGGRCELRSQPGLGTTVVLSVPLTGRMAVPL
jgi:signal transduction histidine kinase